MIVDGLNGLILSGGKSTRMGFDKGTINYHGLPQREFLSRLLGQFCSKVFFSCKDATDVPVSLNPLPDNHQIESPLNGILTAFENDPGTAWLTVPVDMPSIDQQKVSYLIGMRDANALATCFFDSDGKNPEPLFCIWEKGAYSVLRNFYEQGNISPRDFLRSNNVKILSSPFPDLHLNINSKEELEQYRKDHS